MLLKTLTEAHFAQLYKLFTLKWLQDVKTSQNRRPPILSGKGRACTRRSILVRLKSVA
jgi:hypothetical protein